MSEGVRVDVSVVFLKLSCQDFHAIFCLCLDRSGSRTDAWSTSDRRYLKMRRILKLQNPNQNLAGSVDSEREGRYRIFHKTLCTGAQSVLPPSWAPGQSAECLLLYNVSLLSGLRRVRGRSGLPGLRTAPGRSVSGLRQGWGGRGSQGRILNSNIDHFVESFNNSDKVLFKTIL